MPIRYAATAHEPPTINTSKPECHHESKVNCERGMQRKTSTIGACVVGVAAVVIDAAKTENAVPGSEGRLPASDAEDSAGPVAA